MSCHNVKCMDSLEFLATIPDKSVDLVFIDPPYNIHIKKNDWDNINNYLNWMEKHFLEFERILRITGSFYFFHNNFKTMKKLDDIIEQKTDFFLKNLITISKPENQNRYRNRYPNHKWRKFFNTCEYLLFYTLYDSEEKLFIKTGKDTNTNLRKYFYKIYNFIGKSLKEIITKHGRKTEHCFYVIPKKILIEKQGGGVDHCFRYGSSQWALPSKETYNELKECYKLNKMDGFRDYEDIKKEYLGTHEKHKNSGRYTFNLKGRDGLDNHLRHCFQKGRSVKNHPCQKPIKLIEDIIKISSNEGDVVLDCFLGSGTCLRACKTLKRICWGCENNKEYYKLIESI